MKTEEHKEIEKWLDKGIDYDPWGYLPRTIYDYHIHKIKQDEQPQADDKEGVIRELKWCVNNAHKEIQSLKQANAELVKELSDMCTMARGLGWHEATTGRQIILNSSEELLKKLSKHDKQ